MTIQVLQAAQIRTMSRNHPQATHVAIKDGRVLAVGDAADLPAWQTQWGPFKVDTRLAENALMPGFVEAHGHAMEGGVWRDLFLGFFARYAPEGQMEGGLKSIDAVLERLKQREAELKDPDAPLLAWGFDPIYYDGARLKREQLDAVSKTRPILIMHASFHIMNVNSWVLEKGDMLTANVEGILKDDTGHTTGELQEMAAMFMAVQTTGGQGLALRELSKDTLMRFATSCVNVGVTTCSDLHQHLDEDGVATYEAATESDDFPLRCVPALGAIGWSKEEGVAQALAIKKRSTDKLKLGLVKIMTDGSIQGFTGRLKWPGYHNGAPNGLWNLPPATLANLIHAYNAAGVQMHLHVNGDQASEFVIETLGEALRNNPFPDHRHTLQHCQMADTAQFRRMKALNLCANLFANHIYYWGDQHFALTMGPDRARRMDACGTALAEGVPLAIHSDVPVTPLSPLFTAWCAVNRQTATGKVLGEEERISIEDALYAITLGAAYQLKMDGLVGSIEVGKFADFAILDQDPMQTAPETMKDIKVLGTVVSGQIFASKIHEDLDIGA